MPLTFDNEVTISEKAGSTRLVDIHIDPDNMKIQLNYLLLDANGNTVGKAGGQWEDLLLDDGETPDFDPSDLAEFDTTMASMKSLLYKFGVKKNIISNGTVS